MPRVVIAIGSNCERERHIASALDRLQAAFGDLQISSVYQSCASQPDEDHAPYYNLVVVVKTPLAVAEIKAHLLAIEDRCQRQRGAAQVTLDLDLLLYDNWVGCFDQQDLPHPDITRCAYVLRPLMELLPDEQHPVLQQSYRALWQQFPLSSDLTPVDLVWQGAVISTRPTFLPL